MFSTGDMYEGERENVHFACTNRCQHVLWGNVPSQRLGRIHGDDIRLLVTFSEIIAFVCCNPIGWLVRLSTFDIRDP